MTSNVQISGKSNSGIIFVVGGDTFDDFFANLITAYEGDAVQANETVKQCVALITPPSSHSAPSMNQAIANVQQGFGQQPAPQQQQGYGQQQPQQQAQQGWNDNRMQQAGPPPGQNQPLCPNHNAPAKWVEGGFSTRTNKAYTGFWSCAQGDKSCKIRS